MKYKLIKCSYPSWEEHYLTLEALYKQLDKCICGTCKLPEQEYTDSLENGDELTYVEGLPENFDSFPIKDKVIELLATPCGCEYYVEELVKYGYSPL